MKLLSSRICQLVAHALILSWAAQSAAAGITIHGAGATFPFPVYAKWAANYQELSGITVTYEPVGSGSGISKPANAMNFTNAAPGPDER